MVTETPFGTMPDGRPFHLFRLHDDDAASGITVRVTNLGATITGLDAPDRADTYADVLLGFDDPARYLANNAAYFGATIGPSANRVAGGRVEINGTCYQLLQNEGENNLHTDPAHGLHAQLWAALPDARGVTMACAVPDGAYGLPGNRQFLVRYEVEGSVMRVRYRVTTDAPTFVNLTNHAYFNLAGEGSGSVLSHELALRAHAYTPADAAHIPTGEIAPVAGTPFDFTKPRTLGARIDEQNEQLAFGGGYDHNVCVDGYEPDAADVRTAAVLTDPASGRTLTLATTLPGLQVYTGNFVGEQNAKNGHDYHGRESLALEPQFYPATPSHPGFPQPVCTPAHPYEAVNEYRFSVR